MHIMFILMGFSLLAATGFLLAYLWAVRHGQFEDKYTPSVRILFDDKPKQKQTPKDALEERGE
jgi:cbb3-type cytochrome oxidase maturation protein